MPEDPELRPLLRNTGNPQETSTSQSLSTESILTGVSSGLGAFSNILAIQEQQEATEFRLEQAQKEAELQEDVLKLQTRQKQSQINERLFDTLSNQEAALSASGIDVGSQVRKEEVEDALDEASLAKQSVRTESARQILGLQSRQNLLRTRAEFVGDKAGSRMARSALQGFTRFGREIAQNRQEEDIQDRLDQQRKRLKRRREQLFQERLEKRRQRRIERQGG